jgi:hypothetical protein
VAAALGWPWRVSNAPPFVIFGLPRSRTKWLSAFLSSGGFECGHEQARYLRSPDDIRAWLSIPAQGTAETAAAPFWRTLAAVAPNARVVVVRRPPDDVIASLLRLGIGFDVAALTAIIRAHDAKLDQIAARWPGALSVDYAELAIEATCARVFEHCLPFAHDPAWWRALAPLNLQINLPALMRYAAVNAPQMEKLRSILAHQTRAALQSRRTFVRDDVTIAEEPFDGYFIDGERLRQDQYVAVGEAPEYRHQVNYAALRRLADLNSLQTMIARCNGAVACYLLSIISPSLDDAAVTTAYHSSFYASPAFVGLGLRLAIAANDALRAKGITEIVMRAGTRGDGPRLGLLWQFLGAEPCGELFMLKQGSEQWA